MTYGLFDKQYIYHYWFGLVYYSLLIVGDSHAGRSMCICISYLCLFMYSLKQASAAYKFEVVKRTTKALTHYLCEVSDMFMAV